MTTLIKNIHIFNGRKDCGIGEIIFSDGVIKILQKILMKLLTAQENLFCPDLSTVTFILTNIWNFLKNLQVTALRLFWKWEIVAAKLQI